MKSPLRPPKRKRPKLRKLLSPQSRKRRFPRAHSWRLAFRNIDPRAVTSVYVDIHIFDKATNELAVVRDRRYLVPILGRDAVFGADEEIDVDDAAYSFSVAIKKVQFEGEDVFWNGSASLLFENLPEQAKIADVMEDEDLRAQYQRDFTEMAEDKEAAAQFVPQEYKDLWMCACGEVNHKDEEKCAACGAEYGPQHALFEDEEKLKENLEAYNKAEAEKAEAARIAAEKKAAEEKAAAEAAARKAAEEKAAAEEAARKKRLHRKIFLSISIPLAVLIAVFIVVLIVYIIPQNHYNDAAALLEAGKYDEAITAFTALDGYSDSGRSHHGGRVQKSLRLARKREIRRSHRSLHRPRRLRRQQRSDHRGRVPPCHQDV